MTITTKNKNIPAVCRQTLVECGLRVEEEEFPCVSERLVECVSKQQQQKVPRVSGWVRGLDQSVCVAM